MRCIKVLTVMTVVMLCWGTASAVTAELRCREVRQAGFLGTICRNGDEAIGSQAWKGEWILDGGGDFLGSVEIVTKAGTSQYTKQGWIRTPTLEGTLKRSEAVVSGASKTAEAFKGTEYLASGGVFNGTTETFEDQTKVYRTKRGLMQTTEFSGTYDRSESGVVGSPTKHDERFVGTWTVAPDERFKGSYRIQALGSKVQVTDDRVRIQ